MLNAMQYSSVSIICLLSLYKYNQIVQQQQQQHTSQQTQIQKADMELRRQGYVKKMTNAKISFANFAWGPT